MGQFFKWLLISLVIILIVSADVFLVLKMGWPIWAFLIVLLAVVVFLGIIALLVKLYRYWLQRRSLAKSQAAEEAASRMEGREAHTRIRQLQKFWRDSVRLLRKSRLRRTGNPVSAFPWYLLIGPEDSGKTSAIKNSRVAVPFSDIVPGAPAAAADACQWWFLDEAIILDMPGRYTTQGGPTDAAEWKKLLHLVSGTRKLAGINGLVICIGADTLINRDTDSLKQEGLKLRQRINDVMQLVGTRCPVYIMVTKCDQIEGMTKFFQSFPSESLNQAMGMLNEELIKGARIESILQSLFARLRHHLNQLQLVLLGSSHAEDMQLPAILFPEEFSNLQDSLHRFLKPVFEQTPYQDTPMFRGLFFSSAHQEGRGFSALMSRLGFDSERQALPVSNMSYFLRDFFEKILINDRKLAAPTRMALGLRRLAQNVGLTAWGVACVLAGILISVSFVKNLSILRVTFDTLPPSVKLKNDFEGDLQIINKFRFALHGLEEHNNSWWLPRLGLTHSARVAERLKQIYTGRFRTGILQPLDKNLDRSLQHISKTTPPQYTASHVDFMTKRIRLLKGEINEDLDEQELSQLEQPDFGLFSNVPDAEGRNNQTEQILNDYRTYLVWQDDQRILDQELTADQARIRGLLTREGIGLDWLTDWVRRQDRLQDVTGKQYWGSDVRLRSGDMLQVSRAFTPAGWDAIAQFLAEIEQANKDDPVFIEKRQEYLSGYRRAYFSAWQKFLVDFYQGASVWQGREKRIELASKLASKASPYQQLLKDAAKDLQAAVDLAQTPKDIPDWVNLIYRFEQLNDPDYQAALQGGKGVLDKLASKGGKVIKKLQAELKGRESEEKLIQRDRKAVPHLIGYQETLKQTAESAQASKAAFELAKDVFIESEVSVGEPQKAVSKNFWEQARLRELIGDGKPTEQVFWQLLTRQTEQVWSVLLDEAELYIQRLWENDVLAQGIGLSGWELIETLQGFSGKVWEFQKKTVGPFIRKSRRKGYRPVTLYNDHIDFSKSFLHLLNRGRVGKDAISGSYRIRISALPTDTNVDASIKPHETRLVVQCGSGNQELVNHNFPISKNISWSPQDCGDVVLEIYVGDIVLKKTYHGYKAFINFLEDFRTGRKVFSSRAFPEQKGLLAGYGIRTITLGYAFSGQNAVLRLARSDPAIVPDRIIGK